MTFLNPLILWGLAAIAIPIIIHFFNLQRPRQVLFSNVAFVKEVKKTVVNRLKLQRWLLLLARILAITCLVLAFANPVILEAGRKNLLGNRSVAVIVDNSYSMNAGNEKGSYFQQATSLARSIVNAYTRQDEVLVMNSSDPRLNHNFSEMSEGLESVKDLKVKQNVRSFSELLGFQDEIFARSSNNTRELYFVSDFQSSTVMTDSQLVELTDTNVSYKFIPLASRAQKNVYVAEHEILSRITEKGKPVRMSMRLVNDSDKDISDLGIKVNLEGEVVAISNQDIESNSTLEFDLAFTPTASGWLSGSIELDDYPVEYDNHRYFSMYVPEQEKVLVFEGTPSPNVRILYKELFTQFDPEFVSVKSVSSVQFSDFRSIVLLGINEVSSGLAEKLSTFVEDGGSIMFFPGEDMDLSNINLFMNGLGVGSFGQAVSLQTGSLANQADLDHPIFEGIYTEERRRKEFDAPMIFRYHPISLNNEFIHNRMIGLENQNPILLESRIGEGVVFTFTFFPGDKWTDFQLKTIFAPLMFRATQIMNQTQSIASGQYLGFFEPKSILTSKKDLITLKKDDGNELIPEQYAQGGATVLNFNRLELSEGNYSIEQDGEILEKISFNIPDQESELGFASPDGLKRELKKAGYSMIEVLDASPDAISRRISVEKEGVPLWKYFVILALLFFIAEVLLVRFGKK